MKLELSRFANGGGWAEIVCRDGSTTITSDVDSTEFASFALHLMDMSYDLLRAAGRDDILEALSALLEKVSTPKEIIDG